MSECVWHVNKTLDRVCRGLIFINENFNCKLPTTKGNNPWRRKIQKGWISLLEVCSNHDPIVPMWVMCVRRRYCRRLLTDKKTAEKQNQQVQQQLWKCPFESPFKMSDDAALGSTIFLPGSRRFPGSQAVFRYFPGRLQDTSRASRLFPWLLAISRMTPGHFQDLQFSRMTPGHFQDLQFSRMSPGHFQDVSRMCWEMNSIKLQNRWIFYE